MEKLLKCNCFEPTFSSLNKDQLVKTARKQMVWSSSLNLKPCHSVRQTYTDFHFVGVPPPSRGLSERPSQSVIVIALSQVKIYMYILQQIQIVAKQIEIYFGRNISIAERQIAQRNGFTSLGKSFAVGWNKI